MKPSETLACPTDRPENAPEKLVVADVLDAVPVRNETVRQEEKPPTGGRSEDEMVLRVPLKRRWYMHPPFSWLLPFSTERAVGLDRLGTEVWGSCDGKTTTERIIEQFALRHHLTFHEARICVVSFLRSLTRRGLIVMVKEPASLSGRQVEGGLR